MIENKKTVNICDNVTFNAVIDKRFKRNRITVNFINPLNEDEVAANALVINVLKNGHANCPEYTNLAKICQELYGASLYSGVEKRGDVQVCHVTISGIDNRYALDGEDIITQISLLLKDILFLPLIENNSFRQQYIDIERTQMVDLIESEINDKRTYVINSTIKEMARGSLFGVPKLGTIEQVKALTNDDLMKAYNRLINNSKIDIMFTGCGDYNKALEVFKGVFTNGSNRVTLDKNKPLPVTSKVNEVVKRMNVAQGKLVLGFTTGVDNNSDTVRALKLMVAIFGATPFSKLFLNVREKLQLCYYCAARYDKVKGILLVDSGVEFPNIDKAKDEILVQLDLMKKGEFTDEEMNNALLSVKNSLNCVYDSASSVESFYMSQMFDDEVLTPIQEIQKIEKVTREDIINAANKVTLDTVYLLTKND